MHKHPHPCTYTLHIDCIDGYIPAKQGNVATVESVVTSSVILYGNSSDILITGVLVEGCAVVLLVSVADTEVDSFCSIVKHCVMLVAVMVEVVDTVGDFWLLCRKFKIMYPQYR